jgi:hypothetical protein
VVAKECIFFVFACAARNASVMQTLQDRKTQRLCKKVGIEGIPILASVFRRCGGFVDFDFRVERVSL